MKNPNEKSGFVKIGLEVGEHISDFENFIGYIKSNYDITKIDFILITMKPIEIPERLWLDWARFFKDNGIYFAFLYTQQRGAPEGRQSHLTREIVSQIKEIAGEYFVGDMIGETGGLASWQEGYYEDLGIPKPDFDDLKEAKDHYVEHVKSRVQIDRELDVPAVLAVEATTLHRYNFQAGVDYTFVEMMCGNPEVMFASARGASKAYEKNWWASHVANEWYGGFRNDDPLKYKRLKLAYYYSFISGAKYIYPESGDIKISSYGYDFDASSEFCKAYRTIWNEFADFVHLHKRPERGPKVRIGFLQGNLDSWTGWGGATVWNRFNKEEWVYGPAEQGWEYLNGIFKGEKWHTPTVYGEIDATSSVPYGQYDIVPVEAPAEVLEQYSCLILLGWNTMTGELYEKLKEYVYKGGRLFMSVPHLNTSCSRGDDYILINNGDYSELFGCIVKGKGKKYNCGVKFIEESSIPGYLYPYTRNGICDPICAAGNITCADVQLAGGKIIAILADRFMKWSEDSPPILIENAYGKGFASLITSWDYPGSTGMSKFMQVLLRAIVSGEQKDTEVKVIGSDKIYYSVYPWEKGQYIIYLLNTDYNVSNKAKISCGSCEMELEVSSCDIRIVYIADGLMCSPANGRMAVEQIDRQKDGVLLNLAGSGEQMMQLSLTEKPVEAALDGRSIPFTQCGTDINIQLNLNGCSTLIVKY